MRKGIRLARAESGGSAAKGGFLGKKNIFPYLCTSFFTFFPHSQGEGERTFA